MARRRYTDEQRAEAVALLQANGYPDNEGALTKTADALNMPRTTLSGWATEQHNPPPTQVRQQKTYDLAQIIQYEILSIFKQMGTKRDAASYKDLATAFGILVDKKLALDHGGIQKHATILKIVYDD